VFVCVRGNVRKLLINIRVQSYRLIHLHVISNRVSKGLTCHEKADAA
jgi:hypothetical protein